MVENPDLAYWSHDERECENTHLVIPPRQMPHQGCQQYGRIPLPTYLAMTPLQQHVDNVEHSHTTTSYILSALDEVLLYMMIV